MSTWAEDRWHELYESFMNGAVIDEVHDVMVRKAIRDWLADYSRGGRGVFSGTDENRLDFIAMLHHRYAWASQQLLIRDWAPRLTGAWQRALDHFTGSPSTNSMLRWLADGGPLRAAA